MLCTLYFRHIIKHFTYIFIEYSKLLRCECCYPHFIKEANLKHIMGKLALGYKLGYVTLKSRS